MTTLRCCLWTAFLLIAVAGPKRCPGRPPSSDPTPTEDVEPPAVVLPAIDAISHDHVVIGGTLSLTGTGLLDVTAVSIGGVAQPFFEVVDETSVRIAPVVRDTPLGFQDLV